MGPGVPRAWLRCRWRVARRTIFFFWRTVLQTSEHGPSAANHWGRPDPEPHSTPPNLTKLTTGGRRVAAPRRVSEDSGEAARKEVLGMGRDCTLAAKKCAAATERNPDHRATKAATHAARCEEQRFASVPLRAGQKWLQSALQRPPTLRPTQAFAAARSICIVVSHARLKACRRTQTTGSGRENDTCKSVSWCCDPLDHSLVWKGAS